MSSCFNRNGCRSCGCNNNTNSCGCGNTAGTNTNNCGCSSNRPCCNNNWNGCSGVGGANTGNCGCNGWLPPFPPQNSVCGTCPPGTRPCNQWYPPFWNGCGCNPCCNSCGGNTQDDSSGTYAFFNSTGSTITSGSIIPLRYVIGSGELGRGTTGGTVSLNSGIYSVEYSLNASADLAGTVITVTPEYLGALHPEYSRSFTTSAADQTFDIAGSFVVNLPTDTTLSLNVTLTPPCTEPSTLTAANASMLIRRITSC